MNLIAAGLNSHPEAIAGLDKFQVIIGYFAYLCVAIAIGTLVGVGASMVVAFERGEDQNIHALGRWAAGALLAAGAGSIGGSLLGFNLFTSTPQAIPGLTMVQTVISAVAYIAGGVCILGVIWTGGLMMLRHRRGEPFGERLVYVAAGCFIVGGAGGIVNLVMS
ncbi:MAG: TrbC/VirB2 family protein [Jatrophihabitantaceae bacterium]